MTNTGERRLQIGWTNGSLEVDRYKARGTAGFSADFTQILRRFYAKGRAISKAKTDGNLPLGVGTRGVKLGELLKDIHARLKIGVPKEVEMVYEVVELVNFNPLLPAIHQGPAFVIGFVKFRSEFTEQRCHSKF